MFYLVRAIMHDKPLTSSMIECHRHQINILSLQGHTVLHTAIMRKKIDDVKLLLKHGADPLTRNAKGHVALAFAVMRKVDQEIVNTLIPTSRVLFTVNTPLTDVEIYKILRSVMINYPVPVFASIFDDPSFNRNLITPKLIAKIALDKRIAHLDFLYKKDVDLTGEVLNGKTLLQLCNGGFVLNQGYYVMDRCPDQEYNYLKSLERRVPPHRLIRLMGTFYPQSIKKHIKKLCWLSKDDGADEIFNHLTTQPGCNYYDVYMTLIECMNLDFLPALSENAQRAGVETDTFLERATEEVLAAGDYRLYNYLTYMGADYNKLTQTQRTGFITYLCSDNHPHDERLPMINKLLDLGADASKCNLIGFNDIPTIKRLVAAGADPSIEVVSENLWSSSPLHRAILDRRPDLFLALIECGANPHLSCRISNFRMDFTVIELLFLLSPHWLEFPEYIEAIPKILAWSP